MPKIQKNDDEASDGGLRTTALFGMLSAADPVLERCVLISYRNHPREKFVWMVGVFRKLNDGIWFRCDGTQQGFPYRNIPGVADSTARWMYLPNNSTNPHETRL